MGVGHNIEESGSGLRRYAERVHTEPRSVPRAGQPDECAEQEHEGERSASPDRHAGALAIVRWSRRQVGDERIEFAIRAGGEHRSEPLVELLNQ